jgi:two-component system, cell cycle response regulator DivK
LNKKIIVVEDDTFSKEYYKYILKRKGFDPIVFEEGDRLLEVLENEKIELIIMDINLKNTYLGDQKVDGIFLSRLVKENYKYKKIPILLVTAYSLSADGPEFFEDSLADDYITKPIVDYRILLEKINFLIDRK